MPEHRAIVFANGDCNEHICSLANINENDFLLCVDGGVRHCLNAQLVPDVVVGDLDSLDEASKAVIEKQQVECVRYPSDKDASDLALGLALLVERSFNNVVLLGVSGGRSDHALFNWQLAASQVWPFQLRLIDHAVDTYVVDATRPLSMVLPLGQTFSVVPLASEAAGVSVSGARYPLREANLAVGSTLGLSNEVAESRLQVSVDTGIVLVMLVHQETKQYD